MITMGATAGYDRCQCTAGKSVLSLAMTLQQSALTAGLE